ncbi:hypothetical protein GWK47_010459 [Chionoecetes opilio]|uniref:Uncharacterized protein n=1 Tax=Chionoecetes opilio TaxID=41210 RepID=A0A8J5C394_CHIOP|nr:hypothetical protein GWK47_010459 [Chionoecetes opilio]
MRRAGQSPRKSHTLKEVGGPASPLFSCGGGLGGAEATPAHPITSGINLWRVLRVVSCSGGFYVWVPALEGSTCGFLLWRVLRVGSCSGGFYVWVPALEGSTGQADPNTWMTEVLVPMGSLISQSEWHHILTGLQPATQYTLQLVFTVQGTEPIYSPVFTYAPSSMEERVCIEVLNPFAQVESKLQ